MCLVASFFFTIRKTILSTYPALFDLDEDEDNVDEDGNNVEIEEADMESTFEQVYGWFAVINRICADDLTKHEIILGKGVLEVLNQLQYLVEKDKEMAKRYKQAQSQ